MDEQIKTRMRYELMTTMQKWIDAQIDKHQDDWSVIGWVGKDLAANMADAAFSVLAAVSNVNDYIESEHLMK